VADYFFTLFELAYIKYLQSKPQVELTKVTAFDNLLNNVPFSKKDREQLTLGTGMHWLCFILNYRTTESYIPLEFTCATLNALMPDVVISVIRGNEIWGLLRVLPEPSSESELEKLGGFITNMGYYAGFSKPYNDISQTNVFLRFARFAIETGMKAQEPSHIFHFETYIQDYIITRYAEEFPAEHLYPDGLRLLIKHDLDSKISYIQTLRVYLDKAMSISETAEVLYLHRSSLVNRIERISRLLGMNLYDPKARLYVLLCLHLIDKERG
jgi:PucR C-terminal helix-turn-helix domain